MGGGVTSRKGKISKTRGGGILIDDSERSGNTAVLSKANTGPFTLGKTDERGSGDAVNSHRTTLRREN